MKKFQLLILVLALGFFGCSSNNDDEIPDDEITNGSFSVSLSGEENREVKGEAFFVHGIITSKGPEENGSVLTLSLTNAQNEDELITILIGKIGDLDGIGTGTYDVKIEPEDDEYLVNIGAYYSSSMTIYLSTNGKVIITKVTNNVVEGSVDAILDNLNGKTMTVKGKFVAEGVTQNL